jgi:anti-sigma B factor antagonist
MSLSSPLQVPIVPERAFVRVSPRGEIDVATSDQLREALGQLWSSGWDDVVVDLQEVEFMDTSGVHVLLEAHRHAEAIGARLSYFDGSAPVARILKLTGMDNVLRPADPARRR